MTMHWIAGYTAPTSSSVGQVLFASIPQTFTHLQLRISARTVDSVVNSQTAGLQLNGVGTNSYNGHQMEGNGSAVSFNSASFYNCWLNQPHITGANAGANIFGVQLIDISDYSNTSKNKTIRAMGGFDNNGSGTVGLYSGLFISTNAITSILWNVSGNLVAAGTTFDLYGITTSPTTGV
jgi:hypothetical protein